MNKPTKTYSIDFTTNLEKSIRTQIEINSAMRIVERTFRRADKKLRKILAPVFCDYPNNYYTNCLSVVVNVDKEDADHCGGMFYPEDCEIIINKYVIPIVDDDKPNYVMNLIEDRKRLFHIVIHELIHYAFTEYHYADGETTPQSWTVGLCSKEDTSTSVNKQCGKKWEVDEWLDEMLTERLAMTVSGFNKTAVMFYEDNVKDEDKPFYDKVKDRFINGPLDIKNILYALYYHDKKYFFDDDIADK